MMLSTASYVQAMKPMGLCPRNKTPVGVRATELSAQNTQYMAVRDMQTIKPDRCEQSVLIFDVSSDDISTQNKFFNVD
jgi:hypothetical protein